MAVDDVRRRDDLYEVELRPHDERVGLDGWTYYVRAVRRPAELLPRTGLLAADLLVVPLVLARGLRRLTPRRAGWIVGVVRLGSVSTWNDLTPRVVHQEGLPLGADPRPRIAALVAEVRAGRHASPPAGPSGSSP